MRPQWIIFAVPVLLISVAMARPSREMNTDNKDRAEEVQSEMGMHNT